MAACLEVFSAVILKISKPLVFPDIKMSAIRCFCGLKFKNPLARELAWGFLNFCPSDF
jgi:hypothetical protein